jgi:hypothetical protein
VSAYEDRWIECTDTELLVKGYYFAWGDFGWATKRIPYRSIKSVERFDLTRWRGKYRIWGSGDFTHWGNYDPQRPKKSVGFFLHLGGHVIPFVTPDDPDAFEQALRAHVPVRSPG